MTKNQVLELFLTSLFETQYDICAALGLSRTQQPRISQAFKGEKHSYLLIVRLCEEKRVLTEGFLESIVQMCEKRDDKIIILQNRLIEKQQENNRITRLFHQYLDGQGLKNGKNDKHRSQRAQNS